MLFCFSIPESLVARAQEFGITVLKRKHRCDSPELGQEILFTKCAVAVFDGYEFTKEIISNVFDHDVRVVIIDDNGDLASFPCHLILNQNLHADASMYANNKSSPQLLLGLSWALIRPEIASQINIVPSSEKSGILLSIGGTDHLGITSPLYEAISKRFNEEIFVTTGVLMGATLTPLEMALVMAKAKVGVIACGTTMWEAICLNLPFVGLITADNQVRASESLRKHKVVQLVDVRGTLDVTVIIDKTLKFMQYQELRDEFSRELAGLIDGLGSSRVAEQLKKLLTD
jgi:spore coat polysaccharide biosynthesis predicted glycosyltransferase SpsG